MAESKPFKGDWMQSNNRTFNRMIGMFKWIIILGFAILAVLWAFFK